MSSNRLPKEGEAYVVPGCVDQLTIVGLARVDYSTQQVVVYRNPNKELLCLPLADFMWLLPVLVTETPLQKAYQSGIEAFYSSDLEPLKKALAKAGRLTKPFTSAIDSKVLLAGMFSQYTVRFFGLSKTIIASKVKNEALQGLVRRGIIELRLLGEPLAVGQEITSGTEVYLKKRAA